MKDLKQKRINAEMTQFELAKAVGVSINTIVKWEAEISKPGEENYRKLVEVLNSRLIAG